MGQGRDSRGKAGGSAAKGGAVGTASVGADDSPAAAAAAAAGAGTARGLDVLVVGAGIAGLAAARELARAGLAVRVLDKGRGAGGRMATRRIGDARLDHGAQYMTARDPRFCAQVDAWVRAGLARQWSNGFAQETGGQRGHGRPDGQSGRGGRSGRRLDGEARWIGVDGMAPLARSLGEGLDVRIGVQVAAVRHSSRRGWTAATEDGTTHAARAVVLTPPAPQTLALLDTRSVALPAEVRKALEAIVYLPCLTLLVRLDGPAAVPAPGAIWCRGEPIAWIADNRAKGVSRAAGTGADLTIQAGPRWSAEHFDAHDDAIADALLRSARRWLGDAAPTERQVHRWRHAIAGTSHPSPTLVIDSPGPAAFAGDGFGGARIEGAYLSGLEAAAALVARLR